MGYFSKLFKKNKYGLRLPEGWTETKISDNTYKTHIPEDQIQKWQDERRKKDKVEKLVNKNGFHLKSHGRSGIIYYVNHERIGEFDFEISGVSEYSLLFNYNMLDNWFYPTQSAVTNVEKSQILLEFEEWLSNENIKGKIY